MLSAAQKDILCVSLLWTSTDTVPAVAKQLHEACALGVPLESQTMFSFFSFFFLLLWSINDIIKYEWEIWPVPLCSMSERSRWCGKDNPSPDRGTQLGCWGPDGLLTTGNHSQHADTLTSTQMGYQNYPEHLGYCDSTLPFSRAFIESDTSAMQQK